MIGILIPLMNTKLSSMKTVQQLDPQLMLARLLIHQGEQMLIRWFLTYQISVLHTQPESIADTTVAHEMVHLIQAQNSFFGDITVMVQVLQIGSRKDWQNLSRVLIIEN